MEKKRVMVVGGGAAGMVAAIRAAEKGAAVTVLERFQKPGKKLLATGNGRCNLCNSGAPVYFGQSAFALRVLEQMPAARVMGVFERWGLALVQEDGGRVYPACGQASAVLDVLRARMEENGVQVVVNAPVHSLYKERGALIARTEDMADYQADACILATGGLAGGNLGCERGDYSLAAEHGHALTPLSPALAPLITEKSAVRGLAGLRAPVIVTLMDGRDAVSAAQGEMLFADYGVSGICVMQLARDAYDLTQAGSGAWLRVDFSPMMGLCPREYGRLALGDLKDHAPLARELLRKRAGMLKSADLLLGLLPAVLRRRLEGAAIEELPTLLTAFPIAIQKVRSFENAQITRGGIDTDGVNPMTMESKYLEGLYLSGEMLNVDGDCGGYNLLFAFATGLIAGENAAGNKA